MANAAIALSRQGSGAGIEQLVEAVRSTPLKLPLRRAAAEALSRVPEPSPLAPLRELADEYGKFAPPDDHRYLPELHSELLHGLRGTSTRPATRGSRSRSQALRPKSGWKLSTPGAKKEPAKHPSPWPTCAPIPTRAVRVAALKALVGASIRRSWNTRRLPWGITNSTFGWGPSRHWERSAETTPSKRCGKLMTARAGSDPRCAVAAWPKPALKKDVRLASKDPAWQVRATVVEGLPAGRENGAIVRAALEDRSTEVQRRTIAALEKWPLPSAGSILLLALDKSSYASRKAAAEQLSRRWAPAKAFSIDLPSERRAEVMATLQSKWIQEFGQLDRVELASHTTAAEPASPAQMEQIETLIARLTDVNASREAHEAVVAELQRRGETLLAMLEDAATDDGRVLPEPLYLEVFPKMDATFDSLQRLKSMRHSLS